MGLGCKPFGTMESMMRKVKNQQDKEMKEKKRLPKAKKEK